MVRSEQDTPTAAALRDREERLRLAVHAGNVGLWDWDIATNEVKYSPEWKAQLGFAEDEIANDFSEWERRVHPDDLPAALAKIQQHLAHPDGLHELEFRMCHKDGSWRWIYSRGEVFYNGGEKPLRMLGCHLDITARKQAEEKLLISEQRYRTLFEYAPDGIVIADENSRYLDANDAMCRMLGYRREEFIGLSATDIVAPSETQFIEPALKEIQARHDYYREWRMRRKDGSLVDTEVIATTLPDGHLLGLIRDVTARQKIEATLHETQKKCWVAFQSSPVALCITGPDGKYVEVNGAFCTLVGYSREELIGMRVIDSGVIGEAEREKLLIQMDVADGRIRDAELKFSARDGTTRDVVYSVTIIMLGGVEHRLSTAIDVTERIALQHQLAQAQKMQALGTLAGGIAHDFNNLLAVIVGNADLAKLDLPEAHPAMASVKEIMRAGQRAKELVQRILTFSRPNENRLQPIQLSPVLKDAMNLLRSTLPASVELRFDDAANLPAVRADASQIHQVILNLATNAWHALTDKGGCIHVDIAPCVVESDASSQLALKAGNYVRLSVSDTGQGMDAATLERIFEPFFTTKASGQGTGLGLAVVHGIMQSHGGAIVVDSRVGRGSTFHLYFPVSPTAAQLVSEVAENKLEFHGNGEHVLYIDDEESLVNLATRFLTRKGYRVSGFTNAIQALAAFRSNPDDFALVITDFNMPHMSGIEVAQQIFRIAPHIHVAMASGYLKSSEIEKARASGVSEIILKPRSMEELTPIVRQLLSIPPRVRASSSSSS